MDTSQLSLGILLDVYFHCTLFELLMGRHYTNIIH